MLGEIKARSYAGSQSFIHEDDLCHAFSELAILGTSALVFRLH